RQREVVRERRDDERSGRRNNGNEAGDARAAGSFGQEVVFAIEGDGTDDERVNRERQRQQQRETTDLWHECPCFQSATSAQVLETPGMGLLSPKRGTSSNGWARKRERKHARIVGRRVHLSGITKD